MRKLNRREFLKMTGIASADAFGYLSASQRLFANNSLKKNLLFIMTDQQQYKALSIAGNTVLDVHRIT